MNILGNLLRVIAFLLIASTSVGILGGVAAWAVFTLDPTTQEVLGRMSLPPWLSAAEHPKLTRWRP